MRKRLVKKMALNAKRNMTPYRKAYGKGSKKDCRRLRAFGRYWLDGLSEHQVLSELSSIKQMIKLVSDYVRLADTTPQPTSNSEDLPNV